MKFEIFNRETNNIWKKITSDKTPEQLQVELGMYKRLLNFFQVGEYFYVILNFNTLELEAVSSGTEPLLGYRPEELSLMLFMDSIHPDDRPWFLSFEAKTVEFLSSLPVSKLTKYKVRYDFRVKTKQGHYKRLLHQAAALEHDEKGGMIRTLVVYTDITYLKQEGSPVLSYIGMDGEPSFINVDAKNSFVESKQPLSNREKQVLLLLIEGKLSKEIASILEISKQTVDVHRKNMLRKNSLNNTGELVAKAIKQGWV